MPTHRILLVEDSLLARHITERALTRGGHSVVCAVNGVEACQRIEAEVFDAVVTDIVMPGMDGIEFLRRVRVRDPELPVILITGLADITTATAAIELQATAYLSKPIVEAELLAAVDKALKLRLLAQARRQAKELTVPPVARASTGPDDLAGTFERSLAGVFTVYQPIVSWSKRATFAFEAFVRSTEPALAHAVALFDAAERLDRLRDLGRLIRASCAEAFGELRDGALLFVNLHPAELLDDHLYDGRSPLARMSRRVVLDLTERAPLDGISDIRDRVASLRAMGFEIAIDDIGAGYAGLNSVAMLQPQFVKLDMALVRAVDGDPRRQRIVGVLIDLCAQLGIRVVAEGIETAAERDVLVSLGCDLLQGYLFARPGAPFPAPSF